MGCSYKAIADENRRKILKILSKGSATAGDIAHNFKISQPTISNHLKILKEAGLIKENRVRQNRIYSLNKEQVKKVRAFLEALL
ncbi:MAG TPA: metalloregulator ArsR/SmtB family transcription factor [Thermodesulfobacteriota bacterium]|nr:metalloregulator ArsR/SmtB family transcription factor [Thermodesulfobacteriota bacterium]